MYHHLFSKLTHLRTIFFLVIFTLSACGGGSGGGDGGTPAPTPDTTPPVITLNGNNPMTIIQDDNFVDPGATASDNRDGTVTVSASGSVDTSTVGDYTITYSASDAAGNSTTTTRTVNVVLPADTTPPVITLNGDNPINLVIGSSYNELGATAVDDVDGTVSVSITGTVDENTLGSYTITYTAADTAGNTSTATRTVNVGLPPDTTAPVITLNGDNPQSISVGTAYTELGATAQDDVDGDISSSISIDASAVDTNTVGSYSVTYNVSDAAGNTAATQSRTVNVVDTTAPVIILTGDNPQVIEVGATYTELGATAQDNVDGDISSNITIDDSAVDTSTVGSYSVTYNVSDTSGNAATTQTRTVNVADTTAPVITLNGDNPLEVIQASSYNEPGATALDNADGNVAVSISGTVDTSSVGSYTINYSASDTAGNTSTEIRTVNVVAPVPFITTWKTDNVGITNDDQIKIETEGTGYNYTVDWGDGNSDSNVSGNIIHTYAAPGTYTVSISGEFPRTSFGPRSDNLKILSIEQWGNVQWQTMRHAFYKCSNIVGNATDSPNLSQVFIMSSMFEEASAFNGNISNWDTSSVVNMKDMFKGAIGFNQDIGNWDVSSVFRMDNMFESASTFNQDIGNWDVSTVSIMSHMFSKASAFNHDIGSWDVSGVGNMTFMFNEASAFNQNLNSWNVGNAFDMSFMFSHATAFNGNVSDWDVSKVIDMHGLFADALVFNQDIGRWNVSSVINMESMFGEARAFNQDISNWDVSKVISMREMFSLAEVFNQDIGNWDVSKVTIMMMMFTDAKDFNQDIGNWDVSKVTTMRDMFGGAIAFNQDIGNWDVSQVTNMSGLFSSAIVFNQNIGSWDVSKVTDMSSMFSGARVFNQYIGNWDVFDVTNMNSMFLAARAFNQYIGGWKVGRVTDMNSMFLAATTFNQDIGGWRVTRVTDMSGMFSIALAFNQDIGSWQVGSVTNMGSMFGGASNFTNHDLSGWNVINVPNNRHDNFFTGAGTGNIEPLWQP